MRTVHAVTIDLQSPRSDAGRKDYTILVTSDGSIKIRNHLAETVGEIYTPDWERVRDGVEEGLSEVRRIKAAI